MFPGPHASIIRNEMGEPLGWDYPCDEPDFDPYEDDRYDALALARDDGWDTGHDDRLHGRPFDEDAAAIGGPGSTPQSDAWAEGYREGYAEPI